MPDRIPGKTMYFQRVHHKGLGQAYHRRALSTNGQSTKKNEEYTLQCTYIGHSSTGDYGIGSSGPLDVWTTDDPTAADVDA